MKTLSISMVLSLSLAMFSIFGAMNNSQFVDFTKQYSLLPADLQNFIIDFAGWQKEDKNKMHIYKNMLMSNNSYASGFMANFSTTKYSNVGTYLANTIQQLPLSDEKGRDLYFFFLNALTYLKDASPAHISTWVDYINRQKK